MGMMFYLVLAAIAVSGILALLLIFWGRISWPRKKNSAVVEENVVEESSATNVDWHDDIRIVNKTSESSANRIDPALGELGFGALDDLLVESEDAVPVKTTIPKYTTPKKTSVNELIVFYIIAPPQQPFVGYELLQALLSVGLRYGEMSIFHYHQQTPAGQGPALFSLTSAVEPGIFDLGNVGAIVCPGLSLFMTTQVDNPVKTFDLMLETAQQLAEDLNGALCDSQRLPLTETKIAEYRSKIFENSF